jgi:hypothetical protein
LSGKKIVEADKFYPPQGRVGKRVTGAVPATHALKKSLPKTSRVLKQTQHSNQYVPRRSARSGLLHKKFMDQQQNFVVQVGKYSEKAERVPETVAYPFKAAVKGGAGRPLSVLREYIEEIAAPEPQPAAQPGVVPGDPLFATPDAFADKEQRGRGFADRLDNGRFILTPERSDVTPHDTQPGKGLADVFFRLPQNLFFAAEEIDRVLTAFQNGEEVYHKIEGHVADGLLPRKKADAACQASGNGNNQGGVQHVGTILPAPPGTEQVPQREEYNVLLFAKGQKLIHQGAKLVRGGNINGNP